MNSRDEAWKKAPHPSIRYQSETCLVFVYSRRSRRLCNVPERCQFVVFNFLPQFKTDLHDTCSTDARFKGCQLPRMNDNGTSYPWNADEGPYRVLYHVGATVVFICWDEDVIFCNFWCQCECRSQLFPGVCYIHRGSTPYPNLASLALWYTWTSLRSRFSTRRISTVSWKRTVLHEQREPTTSKTCEIDCDWSTGGVRE